MQIPTLGSSEPSSWSSVHSPNEEHDPTRGGGVTTGARYWYCDRRSPPEGILGSREYKLVTACCNKDQPCHHARLRHLTVIKAAHEARATVTQMQRANHLVDTGPCSGPTALKQFMNLHMQELQAGESPSPPPGTYSVGGEGASRRR